MEGRIEHRTVRANGINMHVAEKGQGPVILFIHGFPELWRSWHHQIEAFASLGYRAVAPDLRGYGDTDVPALESAYTIMHVVGDLIALLDVVAGDQEKVFVVGNDWGAYIAWHLCLFRPSRVKALFNIGVAYQPWEHQMRPINWLRRLLGDDYYMCRFQVPGEVEAEFAEMGVERVIKEFLNYRGPNPLRLPQGQGFGNPLDAPLPSPSWMSTGDINYYTAKFTETGFTGGLNYYRNIDRNSELTAPWTGFAAAIKVPVKFLFTDLDLIYHASGVQDYVNKRLKRVVPLLEEVVFMEGAGHFVNQERPEEINEHIYNFFKKFA